jgi:hypothetical protein
MGLFARQRHAANVNRFMRRAHGVFRDIVAFRRSGVPKRRLDAVVKERADPETAFASQVIKYETQDASGRRFLEQSGIARGGRSPRCGRTRTCATGKGHARLTPPLFACRPPVRGDGWIMLEDLGAGISQVKEEFPHLTSP